MPPVAPAGMPHRLHGIIVTIKIESLVAEHFPTRLMVHQKLQALLDFIALIDARAGQRDQPRGRPRPTAAGVRKLLIHETSVGILAALHVLDALVDGVLGDENARVARRSQGHDLADRRRDVGITPLGKISPSSFLVLGIDDQIDCQLEFFANIGPLRHAVHFGQKQRGETVTVHRVVLAMLGGRNQPRRIGACQDVLHRHFDLPAVFSPIGSIPRR